MRVLLVEDYQPVRRAVAQGLTEAGYEVNIASDGQSGLHLATTGTFDVVILDLMLPKVDGLSILQQMRQVGADAHVLILTAKESVADRIRGLDLGADDYLIKPFDFAELLARVRALVRRRYDEKNPEIIVGDLRVNTLTRQVRRGEAEVNLTAREFALLEYLALRAGEVVTRTDVWEHVYDFHDDCHSNVVDVYIGYLRKKIEGPDFPKLIHTRRGHGYYLGELS